MPEPIAMKTNHEKALEELRIFSTHGLDAARRDGFTISTTYGELKIPAEKTVAFLPLVKVLVQDQLQTLNRL